MAQVTQIKRPDSLSKSAEDFIRDQIVRGRFQLGEALQEAKLSSELGISKTPIREALAALNLQGLVQIIPQRGAFVFTLSEQDVVQLCQYRTILEHAALDLALERDADQLLSTLDTVLAAMVEARREDDFQLYLDLDADFHDAFFLLCENNYLAEGYKKVGDIVRTIRMHLSRRPHRTDKSFAEHESIVQSLKLGRVSAAKKVLRTQIMRGERAYSDLSGGAQV
ncbi:GntR family transcriptional regulator [Dinoroseobacter sp. S76]|uniref:GntR family transcriptional regulator n=1 Tax=Dinoroseobacter sp. S76 TaxID=3415124 RepID=UPI003C7CD372